MDTVEVQFANVDEYIASFPEDIRARLGELRALIHEAAPEAVEAIKYHMPTFVLRGNLVSFAAWKKHVSIYPVTTEMEAMIPDIADYKTSGKGTIQFPYDRPLPLDLIREIVAFRVKEALANAK